MKTCPYCAESIDAGVSVCPYCNADVNERPVRRPTPRRAEDDPAMRMLLPVGRSGWAIAAGYLGLISICGGIAGPFALITGLIAVHDINKNPGTHGMGRAIFGIVMGILGCILLAFAVIVQVMQL